MGLENYPEASVQSSPTVTLQVVQDVAANQGTSTVTVVMASDPIGYVSEILNE
jgi:hypothetical protein